VCAAVIAAFSVAACGGTSGTQPGNPLGPVLGCTVENVVTAPNGELGKVSFFYSTAPVCLRGCTFEPLMRGTDETVAIESCSVDLPTNIAVTSDAPNVVSVEVVPANLDAVDGGPNSTVALHVRALANGTAKIRVAKPDGTEIDAITFTVEEPASMVLTSHDPQRATYTPDSLSVPVGQRVLLGTLARDASGANLQGTNGWTISVDQAVASIQPWCTSDCSTEIDVTLGGDNVAVVGAAAGSASITIQAGAVSKSLPLTVTP
jgi:hypothetical protein